MARHAGTILVSAWLIATLVLWVVPGLGADPQPTGASGDDGAEATSAGREAVISRNVGRSPADRWSDPDADGATLEDDLCPGVSGSGPEDQDFDGVGDICDNCPQLDNFRQFDDDGDGVGNECDNCPSVHNPRPPLLTEDFETGAPGWTHQTRGGADTWHLDTQACFEFALGSSMFVSNGNAGSACAVDSGLERSLLLSPEVALPAIDSILLSLDALSLDEVD